MRRPEPPVDESWKGRGIVLDPSGTAGSSAQPRRADPSAGHITLLAAYTAVVGLGAATVGRRPFTVPTPTDVVLIGLATFKLSRLVTKEPVTQPLRAPFVEGDPGPGDEPAPAGGPLRRAVGELLTCPFCVSVWIASLGTLAYAAAPRASRLAASGLTSMAVADASQYALAGLRRLDR